MPSKAMQRTQQLQGQQLGRQHDAQLRTQRDATARAQRALTQHRRALATATPRKPTVSRSAVTFGKPASTQGRKPPITKTQRTPSGIGGLLQRVGIGRKPRPAPAQPLRSAAAFTPFTSIGKSRIPLLRARGDSAIVFRSPLRIDADGSPRAYHPNGRTGLDYLKNAKTKSGRWVGVVTVGGKPVVQGRTDPAQGFYVSPTTLQDKRIPRLTDPRRYVDSGVIPYIALPPAAFQKGGVKLGDFAAVHNRRTGKTAFAIVADQGPRGKIGEGSIALAKDLGIPTSPKHGGEDKRHIVHVVFPGSGNGAPRTPADIRREAGRLFKQWGGAPRLAGIAL